MSTNDYSDLSLIKNQNELVTRLSKILTIEEIKQINLSNLKYNRPINDIQYTYYEKEFKESKKEFKIIDTLILDIYPPIRYISIKIFISNSLNIEFKYKYTKNFIKNIAMSIDKTYNYMIWKDKRDEKYYKGHIINNFSKFLSKLNKETLEELKFIINYLTKDGSIKDKKEFIYNFSIDGYDFIIESDPLDTIKFSIKNNADNNWQKIYLHKNYRGLSDLDFIIDKAILLK